MSAAAKPLVPTASEPPGEFELAQYLADFLRTSEPRVVMILGPPGAGKSSLLRALVPRVAGPKYFLAYRSPEPSPASAATPSGGPLQVPMLLADPQLETSPGPGSLQQRWGPSLLAFGAQGTETASEAPSEITESTRRLVEAGSGSIFVDSWDHGSEKFFRAQVPGPECVRTFTAPSSSLLSMRSGVLSTPVHLILGFTPEAGQPLISLADAVVDLRGEEHPEGRVRVASVPKIRGASSPARDHLYTLEGGQFRSLPGLPPGFRPPIGPPERDLEGAGRPGWPGSAAFAAAFGRLRPGGVTLIVLSPDCPESFPRALSVPLAAHVLLHDGRVVWMPAPSIRPSQIAEEIRQFVPAEAVRARLRFKSAGGDDPEVGEFGPIAVAPAPDTTTPSAPLPGATAGPRGRVFPDVYRFMQDRPAATPALLVASIEGMRAAALSIGIRIQESLVPVEMGFYSRLPNSHIFAYGRADDPVIAHVRSAVDTLIQMEMIHGRPVLFGVRPKTPPLLIDWADPDGSYSLVPVE
jgi:hypothetical protein